MEEKKALVVASFGTSHAETRDMTIGAIERRLCEEYPDREFVRVFTSNFIRRHLAKGGENIFSMEEALEDLKKRGFSDVLIQPTVLLQGFEFDAMKEKIAERAGDFRRLAMGKPLLTSAQDLAELAEGVMEEFKLAPEDALVFVGHGTRHQANAVYSRLEAALRGAGGDKVFLGTIEGDTDMEELLGRVKAACPRKVFLAPFLIVAGDHALHDLAGEGEDSWISIFTAAGFDAECVLVGLGEYSSVRELIVRHAGQAEQV